MAERYFGTLIGILARNRQLRNRGQKNFIFRLTAADAVATILTCAADVVAMSVCLSQGKGDLMSDYKGWSNFETWSVYSHFLPETKGEVDFAKACFADAYEELPVFIRNLIDASKINWGEIYTAVYDADNDDDNDDDQDEPEKPTIMICNCDEWVRDNGGIDFDGVDEVTIKESVEIFIQDLCEELTSFGFKVEFPTDGKSTYHGWNGFRGFKTRWGVCGTFDKITDEQNDLVNQLISESVVYVENKLVVWSRMRSRTH